MNLMESWFMVQIFLLSYRVGGGDIFFLGTPLENIRHSIIYEKCRNGVFYSLKASKYILRNV